MASVDVSTTPNPNAMKFTLDVHLDAMVNVNSPDAATDPLTGALFGVDGVVGVFGTADFVTVSKLPDAAWDAIVPAVTEILSTQL
ncbi:hypothetical protein BH20ACT2_BH20ACT2_00530 [soil metagenome]